MKKIILNSITCGGIIATAIALMRTENHVCHLIAIGIMIVFGLSYIGLTLLEKN